MRTFTEIIDDFGIKPLAEALGLPESHVRTMKARDSIPPEYWAAIIALRPQLSFDRLMEMRSAKKLPRLPEPREVA